MELLNALNKGINNIKGIENGLFDVLNLPLYPPSFGAIKSANGQFQIGGEFIRPESFATYKNTGGHPLGTIGKDYVPTQPKDLFNAFTNCLIEANYDLSTVKYTEVKGGKRVRFSVDYDSIGFKNAKGNQDDLGTKIVLETGYDGKTKTTFSIETIRMICSNGMIIKDSHMNVAFKNTKGNFGKIFIACDNILSMGENIDLYKEQLLSYNSKAISTKEVNVMLKKTLGYDQTERTELSKTKNARLDEVMSSIELEFSRTGSTVWGLLNGITHFTNHIADTDNRIDYLNFGAGLKTNNIAQVVANQLVLV